MFGSVPYIEVPIGAVCCYIFLLFSFFNTQKTKAVKFFQMIVLCCIVWSGSAALMRLQISPGIHFWYNASLLGLFLMPIGIYCFLFCMLDIEKYGLLIFSGIASCLAVLMNSKWNVILAPPEILRLADGKIRYTYTVSRGVYVAILLEVLLCVYATYLAHVRIKGDWTLRKKLIPLLLGTLLILVGNCLELIPGNAFPYSTLAGVGMAVCIVYIMFKQYLFEWSCRFAIGGVYMVALVLVLIPVGGVIANLERVILRATMEGDQILWLIIAALCFWSALVMGLAHKQADRIVDGQSRRMIERVQRFQEETVSLFSGRELYRKMREALSDIFKEADIAIYVRDENTESFIPLEKADRAIISAEENEDITRSIRNLGMVTDHGEVTLLKYNNVIQGYICLKCTNGVRLNYLQVECYHQISNYASVCLKNIEIFQEVYQVSVHDELTGLYNRNYWKQYMENSLAAGEVHSFIYLDMDDFKLFNELYGGACGDDILKWCGKIIMETVANEKAVTFRVGSNEFLIDVRSSDKHMLVNLAKQIQRNVKKDDMTKPKILQPITFSIGIAVYPGEITEFDLLFKQAEKAAFFAKKNGKNRVEVYEVGFEGEEESESDDHAYEQVAPTVYALMAAIDAKDSYTFMHSTKVSDYAVLLAKEIGLKSNEIQIVKEAGLLHDIGKIGVPESILTKQGRLTDQEFDVMKKHVTNSIEMIHFLPNMSYVIPAVLSHHERYDGKGYPRGIAGEDIPLLGRILAVCDSFDAMISKRSYKEAMAVEYAIDELEKNKGKQFDPKLAQVFIELIKEGKVEPGQTSI